MNEPSEPRVTKLIGDKLGNDSHDDVRGRRVITIEREYVGTVDELLIDELQRSIRFLEIYEHGPHAISGQKFLIPAQTVIHADAEQVLVNCSRDMITSAPTYNPHIQQTDGYLREVEEHFGCLSTEQPKSVED